MSLPGTGQRLTHDYADKNFRFHNWFQKQRLSFPDYCSIVTENKIEKFMVIWRSITDSYAGNYNNLLGIVKVVTRQIFINNTENAEFMSTERILKYVSF